MPLLCCVQLFDLHYFDITRCHIRTNEMPFIKQFGYLFLSSSLILILCMFFSYAFWMETCSKYIFLALYTKFSSTISYIWNHSCSLLISFNLTSGTWVFMEPLLRCYFWISNKKILHISSNKLRMHLKKNTSPFPSRCEKSPLLLLQYVLSEMKKLKSELLIMLTQLT